MIKLSELRKWLGDPPASSNALIVELEKAAVEFVQTQTRRYFGPFKDYEEIVPGKGVAKLYLMHTPVDDLPDDDYTAVIVSVDERAQPGADPTAIEDYELRLLEGESVLVRTGGGVWLSGFEYAVLYRTGYAEGTEPADIRQVVRDLVTNRWSVVGHEGLKSETLGGYAYTRFDASDLEDVMGGWATIKAYRRLVVA